MLVYVYVIKKINKAGKAAKIWDTIAFVIRVSTYSS